MTANDDRGGEVLIVSGGPDVALPAEPLQKAFVIAADGGVATAFRLGLQVDLAIGDFDSLDPHTASAVQARGIPIEQHPTEKDQTDLDLALVEARRLKPSRITVLASPSGRLDHLFASILSLAAAAGEDTEVDAYCGHARLHVVVGHRRIPGTPGELISLFAVNRDAHGVTTSGLRYTIRDETLTAAGTRGISNVFTDEMAEITVSEGRLVAMRPHGVA